MLLGIWSLLPIAQSDFGALTALPFGRGRSIFTSRRNSTGGVDFYVQDGPGGKARVLIPAEEVPANAKYPMLDLAVSDDGRMCGYFAVQPGTAYEMIKVLEVKTGKRLKDTILWTKLGDFGWEGNGFYYGGYPEPKDNSNPLAGVERVYYHRLGTPQSADQIVFEDPGHPGRKYEFITSFDHRFLCLHVLVRPGRQVSSSEWFHRQGDPLTKFTPIQPDLAPGRFYLCDNRGDHLVYYTTYKAPGGRIVDVDTNHPEEAAWKTVLPEPVEDGEPVKGAMAVTVTSAGGGKQIALYTMDGKFLKVIPTPTGMIPDIQCARQSERYVFVSTELNGVKSYWLYDDTANKLTPFH